VGQVDAPQPHILRESWVSEAVFVDDLDRQIVFHARRKTRHGRASGKEG
jgi:hypothetical protein